MVKKYNSKLFTPIGQEIIEQAIREARELKHTYVGGLHFQLALNKSKQKHSTFVFEEEKYKK